MKKALLLTVVMMLSASVASAQFGAIGQFADNAGTNCNITDGGGFLAIYTVHTASPGASAVEYSARIPACMVGAAYFSWSHPFSLSPGNPVDAAPGQAGTSTAYGGCLAGNFVIGTLLVTVAGTTTPCCFYTINPHEILGGPSVTDCPSEQEPFPPKQPLATLLNTVNGNVTCDCGAVPTKKSTWGAVKSLYTN